MVCMCVIGCRILQHLGAEPENDGSHLLKDLLGNQSLHKDKSSALESVSSNFKL